MESCLDFRKLNDVTVGDSFPIPNIIDILDSGKIEILFDYRLR